jgi:hypothetical protein
VGTMPTLSSEISLIAFSRSFKLRSSSLSNMLEVFSRLSAKGFGFYGTTTSLMSSILLALIDCLMETE